MQPPGSPTMFDRDLWREARSQRALLLTTIALNAATGGCIVVQAYLLSRIIARVFLFDASLLETRPSLTLLLVTILLRAVLVSSAEASARVLAIRVRVSLRRRLFRHLQKLGPAYLQGERTGELINTLTGGIESLDAYFSQYLPRLVIAVLVPVTVLVAVATGDLLSAGILLLTAPLIPLFMVLVAHGTQRIMQTQWSTLSQMSAHFLDVLQGLTTLKILGQSRAQIERVARISKQYGESTLRVLRISFLSPLVLELVATLSIAIIAVETGLRLLEGTLSFDDALFILILAPEFYLPLRMLGVRFHAGMDGVAAGRRIFTLFGARTPLAQDGIGSQKPLLDLEPIRFRRVSYAFDNGDRPALHDISLDIEPGKHIAIVGHSGAGKSTLTQLLLGFINPQSGQILVGNRPLDSFSPNIWLQQVAWVPQTPYLFMDTVAANIRLGSPDAGNEAVVAAARQANAHDFISQLPRGYQTVIGERGVRLSGGQAQRLALARAFLKNAGCSSWTSPPLILIRKLSG